MLNYMVSFDSFKMSYRKELSFLAITMNKGQLWVRS
jgi:hypothetical protein